MSAAGRPDGITREIEREQVQLDDLFARRDELIEQVGAERRAAAESDGDGTYAEARVTALARRQHELDKADRGLCFGRMDRADGASWYVGRIGLPSRHDDADPLLIDWRAPAARAFYTATAARPDGLRRRRHIRTDERRVIGVDDEVLDAENADAATDLVGEAALMEALDARRTGSMNDIVSTLQAEQDDIIRAPHQGCLVVQGGPGTGKTAVALHRAAYLLFTHQHLVERGVLVVGPSRAFLDYIEQVLPSLGETQVVATTVDRLLPGTTAARHDSDAVAEIKGRGLWADVLQRVIDERQPVARPVTVVHEGEPITLDTEEVAEILAQARAGRVSHHEARGRFRARTLDALAEAVARHAQELIASMEEGFEDILARIDASMRAQAQNLGTQSSSRGVEVDGVATAEDVAVIRSGLRESATVSAALDDVWPALDPQTVLTDLLRDVDELARLAPELTANERALVVRERGADWSTADVALLDELAELVGAPTETTRVPVDGQSLAVRAGADRTWAYGHVIVDEAQELTAMQWRMLLRRCPTRSFTVVGDINQADSPGSARSWESALEPSFGTRWQRTELTVCYRTPHEVMACTAGVLEAAGSTVLPPRAVRSSGRPPGHVITDERRIVDEIGSAATTLADRYAGGRVAVIAVADRTEQLRSHAALVRPDVVVITPEESKGLEFDAVVVVDPHAIVEQRRGWNGLYVALTRCTQELTVVALADGPAGLDLGTPAG